MRSKVELQYQQDEGIVTTEDNLTTVSVNSFLSIYVFRSYTVSCYNARNHRRRRKKNQLPRSHNTSASIHHQQMTGSEAGVVAGQKVNGLGYFVRLSHSSQCMCFGTILDKLLNIYKLNYIDLQLCRFHHPIRLSYEHW